MRRRYFVLLLALSIISRPAYAAWYDASSEHFVIYAYERKAEVSEDEEKAWKDVRKQIVFANRIEPNHPIPLIRYYRSYRKSGKSPPQIAVQGLQRALQLAPFDHGLRMTVAAQYMQDKQYAFAASTLRPVAHNPHRNGLTKAAEKLLDLAEQAASNDETDTAVATNP